MLEATVGGPVIVVGMAVAIVLPCVVVGKLLVEYVIEALGKDGYYALAKGKKELEKSARDLERAELERIAEEYLLEDNTLSSRTNIQEYKDGIEKEREGQQEKQNSTQQGKAENERATNLGKSSPEMGRP